MSRRVCKQCGRNYSVESRPRNDWRCDRCGGNVEARADDQDEAVVRERLQHYYESTAPLKARYERLGVLRVIDGVGSPDEVFDRIVARL